MDNLIDLSKEPDLNGLNQALAMLDKNPSSAEQQLKTLAEKGSLHSMVHLGHLYWTQSSGINSKEMNQAEHWLCLAYKSGSKIATFYLGRLYLKKLEYTKAREVFNAGAEMNYSPSIFHLGRIYRDGLGINKQIDLARSLFERASKLDHIYAKRALGRLLMTGRFGLTNLPKGIALALKAGIECANETQRDATSERLKI